MDNLIVECLETYGNILESFDGWRDGLFLPTHVARQVLLWCDQFCHQYISLAQLADTMNLALFCVKPKLHWFWHLCHRCQYLHPRAGNCFLVENFVGNEEGCYFFLIREAAAYGTKHDYAQMDCWEANDVEAAAVLGIHRALRIEFSKS